MNTKQEQMKLPLNLRIKKRLKLIADKKGLVIIFFIIGLILAAAINFLLPKYYRSSAVVSFNSSTINNSILSNPGTLKSEIDLFSNDKVLKQAATKLANDGIAVSVNDILESTEITGNLGGSSIRISSVSTSGNKSAKISNYMVNEYQEIAYLHNKAPLIQVLLQLKDRDELLQESIRRAISNQQGREISNLNSNQIKLINQISEFETELEIVELENQFLVNYLQSVESILDEKFPNISDALKLIENSDFNSEKNKLERLETVNNLSQLSSKLAEYNIEYPWTETYNLNELSKSYSNFYRILETQVDRIISNSNIENESFVKAISRKIYENQIKLASIDITKSIIFNTLTILEDRFNQIPFAIIDEVRNERAKKFNTTLGIKLKTKEQRFRELEKKFYAEIKSISNAKIPSTYFSPNTTLNFIIGGLVGLLMGVLIAVSSNSSKIELIKSVEDLEESGYKIVAQIPSYSSSSPVLFDELNNTDEKKIDQKVLNAFSSIETFIKYGSLENPLKTILVTSGQDEEGKSVIASNIAIALANNDNKVLLVDADLKKPQLHKFFRIKSTPSLAHFLFRKKELNEIVRKTHNQNLDLITCIEFPQNPSVIITSERMLNFMEQVQDKYDYIVYDSTSLYSLKETATIAKGMDEVILVVRANKTKLSEIISMVSLLDESGVHEFNLVLNDVNLKS